MKFSIKKLLSYFLIFLMILVASSFYVAAEESVSETTTSAASSAETITWAKLVPAKKVKNEKADIIIGVITGVVVLAGLICVLVLIKKDKIFKR